jgi:integrase/recombinase XerD
MSTNVVVSLDKRSQKKDGTFPLILRLGHGDRTASIPLGFSISADEWDENERRIKNSCKRFDSINRVNNLIAKKKVQALDTITRLEDAGTLKNLSVASLKAIIVGKEEQQKKEPAKPGFFTFAQGLIIDMKTAGQVGNARIYGGVLGALRTYLNKKDLAFEEITYPWLKGYETYYFAKGDTVNGLAVNMRTLRAIYNKAIMAGVVDRSHYPFHDYKIRSETTEKRAIDKEDLMKVVRFKMEEDHPLFHTRNYFLASFFMYGMSFIDMAYLKVSSLQGGRIKYRRKKTKKLYDIKIEARLQSILDYYLIDKGADDYLFPIVKRTTIADQYLDIDQARKMYNRHLKELGELCGITQKLTSYVSRHSFATQAMLSDIPINAISEMLGHSSLSTTQIYLKSLPSSILDDYHSRITLED